MIALLTPFLIALGIGAGIAAVIVILAAVSVTVRELVLLVWGIVKELATWPRAFWDASVQGIRDGIELDRERARRAAERKAAKD